MKLSALALCSATLILLTVRVAAAQSTITVTPSAGPVTVSTAVAGQQPAPVVAGGGTYTLRNKANAGSRITARLQAPLPSGTQLWITLGSAGGVVSTGAVLLTVVPQDVLTNVPSSGKRVSGTISYSFNATTAAGVVALRSAVVMLSYAP